MAKKLTLANIVPKSPIKTIKTDQLVSWFKLESKGELTVLWINDRMKY